jgi:ribosomal protein L9
MVAFGANEANEAKDEKEGEEEEEQEESEDIEQYEELLQSDHVAVPFDVGNEGELPEDKAAI